ncbi:MAG: glucosamine-6-phosphate deaminase [Bacteroidetes bacterium]|nr:glucosamine-6-phosphate deaminase [Bacteroidota bacterium]
MKINISENPVELGKASASPAIKGIKNAIAENGQANIILATGASQFETLKNIVLDQSIDWSKVVMFHLDEYIGLPETEPASFRKYLKERFLNLVSALKASYLVNGDDDPVEECKRLNEIISNHPIDVALVGIGENGHLAFNDPPADFDTESPYIIVNLDEKCRLQQLNEGWFKSIEEVPKQAISMSIKQICKAKLIICSVPDARKAEAVKNSLENQVSNKFPATVLQTHPNCIFYLDKPSAALLKNL